MSLATSLTACAKRSPETSSPGMDTAPGDELAMLEQQLGQREAQLQAAGYSPKAMRAVSRDGADLQPEAGSGPPSPAPAEPTPMADSPGTTSAAPATKQMEDANEGAGGRCQQVCEISAAICSLEAQICGLVPRHQDDPRYQAACERAADDCRYATEACNACT